MPVFQSSQNRLNTSGILIRRNLHTQLEAQPVWKAPSLTAISEAVPGSSGIHSEDANILLIILAFFLTSNTIPLDLLIHGATPRKRWTRQGEVEEVDATCIGLVLELGLLLSDMPRLAKAFQELKLSSSVILDSVNSYTVNEHVTSCIRENLLAEHLPFWRSQALIKRFTISQAEVAARNIPDPYLHSCITQSQSLLGRIAGNIEQAASCLGNLSQGTLSSTMDKRMHSAIGQATIQRSLNCIQIKDITSAKRSLEKWSPLNQPSLIEEAVLFYKDIMLRRLFQFEGEFAESLAHLQRAQKTVEEHRVLTFDEDLQLDNPASAKYRFKEAERVCLDIQSRSNLLKFEILRLHIMRAKLYHVQLDYKAIGKFNITNGHSTRIIVISICDTLSRLGHTLLADESLKQATYLDTLAEPGGTQYWIAGMQHWLTYLQSRGHCSQM
ncbi:hypothetical protein P154DRAFT_542650 [Amniculicola lignicola CBS 123094]|uniref:Uncharacterized protein n=1 Tax=Amniculicola lignicola CBS 123094 TaxID=1392246 RepID=A0A6A5WZW3_9PLEO|nr:hypothetical protein P154DRAFT_542650 [Amniculicola lignicola CBS 123094]